MNEKLLLVTILALTFTLGAGAALLTPVVLAPTQETPLFSTGPQERSSPSDTIREDQIKVYRNGVYVDLQSPEGDDWLISMDLDDPTWSTFTDTNSMDPVFDTEANTVRVRVPPQSLQEGDIISYRKGERIIIHRIVHKDEDEEGLYFILKGDNNPTSDPGKVRPDQVLGKVVAIFY